MKTYWRSIEELKNKNTTEAPSVRHDVSLVKLMETNNNASRRDFLKFFGFTITSAALAASCKRPVTKAIPYLVKPEEVTPGKANYYASSYFDGKDYCSLLVKVRDGRPIKVEGNKLSPVTKGGTNASVQASVLSLYDDTRYKMPQKNGVNISWPLADKEIQQQLSEIKNTNKKLVLLTSTIISPTTKKAIGEFKKQYPGLEHIVFDPSSAHGILDANEISFNRRIIPRYYFDKANVIVSVGADFLGTWLAPIEYTRQYASTRKLSHDKKTMSKHIQIESGMSLTGANADERHTIRPSETGVVLASLYNLIAGDSGNMKVSTDKAPVDLKKIAGYLTENRGNSLVVSGSNDPYNQLLVNAINHELKNYGKTIDVGTSHNIRQGDDAALFGLIEQMEAGSVAGLMIHGVNPVYQHPMGERFKKALNNVPLSVSLSCQLDETSAASQFVCPNHHELESWGDAEPRNGQLSLSQPAIRPIHDTRQFEESLLKWAGNNTNYLTYLKDNWRNRFMPRAETDYDFLMFWNKSLHNGVLEIETSESAQPAFNNAFLSGMKFVKPSGNPPELEFYETVAIGNGQHANNPWLQEMPDPVSKITWDNYACVSPSFAAENNLETGDYILINNKLHLPVLVQPGQNKQTISVALGYGRRESGVVARGVGSDAFPLMPVEKTGIRKYHLESVSFEKAGGEHTFAMTQTHHSMEGRPIVRETTLEEYLNDPAAGNELHEKHQKLHATMYEKRHFPGHHWGMAIDLNSCTGCSACLIACSAENNVPVVGKEEVARVHEMHWIRIDRYFSGNPENPEVLIQPVMCQHCDNAPCENVCPVAATNNSSEGVNQMSYNRCIGTRYCNNNCPYKVRRFNFYDYTTADATPKNTMDPAQMTIDIRRLVLNPDVTVRAKGVIEKCSFCIQRIQESKLNAKLDSRKLGDGEIQTACEQACPAEAIIFGDLSDEKSRISKAFANERNYHLLEELHTLPSVGYLTKIRNKTNEA